MSSLPQLHDLIGHLAAGPLPETLVHGDFHPWNVQRDGDRLVIFDWSDACWGHPFFDVPTVTQPHGRSDRAGVPAGGGRRGMVRVRRSGIGP